MLNRGTKWAGSWFIFSKNKHLHTCISKHYADFPIVIDSNKLQIYPTHGALLQVCHYFLTILPSAIIFQEPVTVSFVVWGLFLY